MMEVMVVVVMVVMHGGGDGDGGDGGDGGFTQGHFVVNLTLLFPLSLCVPPVVGHSLQ